MNNIMAKFTDARGFIVGILTRHDKKTLHLGKKIVFGIPPNANEIIDALGTFILQFTQNAAAYAEDGSGTRYLIEETQTEWKLCRVVAPYTPGNNSRTHVCDFTNTINFKKP